MNPAKDSFPVLLLTPPSGRSRAERWLARAQSAAAADLVRLLQRLENVGPIYSVCAEPDDQAMLGDLGVRAFEAAPGVFRFGETVARFAAQCDGGRMAYFGGASAPLVTAEVLTSAFSAVLEADQPQAVVNNLHSSDWVILNHSHRLGTFAHRLPSDNQLGWVLSQEAGHQVESLPPSAASRADIDTPGDLLLLQGHPRVGNMLKEVLATTPDDGPARVSRLRRLLSTPGETLGIIGRASSHVWAELERRTSIWVRLFVEERGMQASGRAARGDVRSLIAMALEGWGAEGFMERIGNLAGGLIWDTRVWMSHRGAWPTPADRCASDLGWADDVVDPALRDLTRAAMNGPIPVILGGHGVVAGGLYAFLESLDLDR